MPTKSPEGKIRISQKRARLQSISGHFSALYAPLWSQKCHKGARGALKNHEKSSFFHFFSIFRHFLTRIRPETGPKSLRSWDFREILGFPGISGISWDFLGNPGFPGKSGPDPEIPGFPDLVLFHRHWSGLVFP